MTTTTKEGKQSEAQGVFLCWNTPLHRPKMYCQAGDVRLALDWYKVESGGLKPWIIRFNPKLSFLAGEVPDGLAIRYSGGTASWEIQIGDAKLFATEGAHAE